MHALVGATVVDVSNGGQNSADVPDSVVLLQGSQIVAVGPRGSVEIPAGTAVVNVSGKFIGACPTCELTASAWTQAFLAAK